MGGFNGNYLSEVFILNISSNNCIKVAQGGPVIGFYSSDNASAKVEDDKIIALTKCQNGLPRLI